MSRSILLLLLSFAISCQKGSFSGGGSSGKGKSTSPTAPAGDPAIEPQGASDAEGDHPAPGSTPQTIPEQCKEVVVLPSSPTSLAELYSWKPQNPAAANFIGSMSPPALATLGVEKKLTLAVNTIEASISDPSPESLTVGSLYTIDAKTGQELWKAPFKVRSHTSPAIADVNGDGINEILVYDRTGKTLAVTSTGTQIWQASIGTPIADESKIEIEQIEAGGPAAVDLDLDGDVEVVVTGGILDGKTGATIAKFPPTNALWGDVAVPLNVNEDQQLEVVTDNGIYTAQGSKVCGFSDLLSNVTGAKLRATDAYATIMGTVITNIGGKPTGKVLVAYRGDTCKRLYQVSLPGEGGGPMNMADFNGDGVLEMGTAGFNMYVAFAADGSTLWQQTITDFTSGVTGSTTFDFNADGRQEVVYADEVSLHILDGVTGQILYQAPNTSGTYVEYPIIADVDGDGHANIVIVANGFNYSGPYLRVFQAPKNDWVGTRQIWNQYAYHPLHVQDSGAVTGINKESIYKKWIKDEYLLGYRNNIPMPQLKKECLP